MENNIVTGSELEALKIDFLNSIKRFERSISSREHFLIGNRTATALCWTDSLRFFLDGLSINSSPVKDLVVSSAYQVNQRCPLAVPLYFSHLLGEKVKVSKSVIRPSSKLLLESVKSLNDDFLQENLTSFVDCLHKAGSAGTITIDSTHGLPETYVEEGYRVICKLDDFFVPYLSSFEAHGCKIIAINGTIVDVSEIHHILESAYGTKKNVVLLASSFSQDVSNTLLVNWQKGNTNVFPFLIEDSLETINEFRDVAELTGCFYASEENGLRLSNVEMNEIPDQSVSFNSVKQELRILLSKSSQGRCSNLRKKLIEKHKDEKIDDVKNILSERIARMSARNVVLKLRMESAQRGLIEDKAAAFFKYFSSCAQQGVVQLSSDYIISYLPSGDAEYAMRRAKQDLATIDNIRAIIRFEE